jgi:thiol-disulfide isomerase/thioredoxin
MWRTQNRRISKNNGGNRKMKRFLSVILILFLFIPIVILGEEKNVNMYLFYGEECPHCHDLLEFLEPYSQKHKNVTLYKYEVWHDEENQKLFAEIHELLNNKSNSIPFLIIGNTVVNGYNKEQTPDTIKNAVSFYSNTEYKDKVGIYLGLVEDNDNEEVEYEETEINIPILGKKNIRNVSIILSTIVIGFVDGYNPCAMWILLFLISMLLGLNDKIRRLALGIVFLLSSALVYFLFLVSWLNLAEFLDKITYVRAAIATIAIIFGTVSILRFIKSLNKDDGCEVVDQKNRKRIINSIKKIMKEKSFLLALLGVVFLAFSVNIIELLCSLGLPVMFSEILTINNVSNTMKIIYSLIYILFFLIDDIVIFIIAMRTLEIKAISNKYAKYSHLIGGIIMLIIGFLMVYKPEWLMFNF